jgi:hypothetical protein
MDYHHWKRIYRKVLFNKQREKHKANLQTVLRELLELFYLDENYINNVSG